MTRRRAAGLCAGAALALALHAPQARAYAAVDVQSRWLNPFPERSFLKTDPISASLAKSVPFFMSIDVAADGRLGTLRATAEGLRFDAGTMSDGRTLIGLGDAGGLAAIEGSGHFVNFQPGQVATLDYFVRGSFERSPSPGPFPRVLDPAGGATAEFRLSVYTPGVRSYGSRYLAFTTRTEDLTVPPFCAVTTTCRLGFESGLEFGSITIPLTADPVTMTARLDLGVAGYKADFMHTAGLYLNVPAGVTFVPDGNAFLSQAVPIPTVPEPGSAALFAAGLAAALGARRLRGPCPPRP